MIDEPVPQTHHQRRLASMRPWYDIWWSAISRPSKTGYDELVLEARVSSNRVFVWIVVTFAVSSAIELLLAQLLAAAGARPDVTTIQQLGFGPFIVEALWYVIQSTFVRSILLLLIAGMSHLVANLLGGRGPFMTFLFVFSAAYLPITVLIQLFPSVVFLAIVVGFYGFILLVYATRSAYSISTGRAIAVSYLMGAVIVGLGVLFAVSVLHI
jgi:hypothetical protein